MKLRRLTPDGIAQFTAYLANLKAEPTLPPPRHLLEEDGASEAVQGDVEVQDKPFATRLEAAKHLDQLLAPADLPQVERDAGLWAWLALYFFDQLCPPGKGGMRKPGELARYVPQIDSSRRYYRHMLLGPLTMLSRRPSASRREQWSSATSAAFLNRRETTTRSSWSIVINPRSNARSKRALRHRPLRGSARRSTESTHGMMWLATSNSGNAIPLIAQRQS
ncbi:MAG: hypothetical protein WBD40_06530 [Tepidisphaeraceae bacterium]